MKQKTNDGNPWGKKAVSNAVVSSMPLAERFPNRKQQLAGTPPHIDLPTDRPRIREQIYREACRSFVLSRKLISVLKDLSEQEHVDLSVTLLATFQILLARYSRQEEIVVATPIMAGSQGRTQEIETFHSCTLALRTDLSGNPTFRALLLRVREVCLTAYGHHGLQSKILSVEAKADPDVTDLPFYQVLFAMHNFPGSGGAGAIPDPVGLKPEAVGLELCLFVWEKGESLEGVVKYNAELFDASTIERLLRHYETLLKSVAVNPDQLIGTLPLLTRAERHQLLVEWNNTETEYPKERCVHQLFEAQARNTPQAVAVAFKDQQLSYRELN
jgi:non-ribosomal peptide synthetase component F